MAFVQLSNVGLFYTDTGSGPPVLLVHGFTADGGDWSFQTPELEREYRVINVDLRGHGRSSVPEAGFALADYIGDLKELLEHLAPGPVIAVGHSIGGAIVIALAVEYPELIRAVAPIDASYGFPEEARPFIKELAALGVGQDGAERMVENWRANFYPDGTPAFIPAWHARRVRGMPAHILESGVAGSLMGRGTFAFLPGCEEYLRRVTCPAFVVRGGSDAEAGMALERMALDRPGSSFLACDNSGHWPHQVQHDKVNRALLDWLRSL